VNSLLRVRAVVARVRNIEVTYGLDTRSPVHHLAVCWGRSPWYSNLQVLVSWLVEIEVTKLKRTSYTVILPWICLVRAVGNFAFIYCLSVLGIGRGDNALTI
jgi:hypothetical protein